ncbi:glycosyl transferase [Virgibacillus pantothenticus]|uniref:B-glycosyltransferase n=1 Tax=Virgibacillus pantothenticus TaxID=1473 RepID=A0A0L0QLX9_VIRPA|nr:MULTISPECIES: glycosyltransferase family 2 protein [Virgibacillus]API93333.1 glycosyltransferase [Virgibacillus sp. 6R]KNE19602.1 b-glycosyltransferase [Virgibacillus pantothenticus]MBS7428613.1 glycosyltransferase family 2 protein [Virgibacillus sp. 19R1-5]MBU8565858.1 glycosyltransferase family 2 protein [Virgibacillus pantothenticus]MBU8599556.1 glycosyltransferase family 2 protein [Virgibacillus pantothenticus]
MVKNDSILISIVIPVYGCARNLEELCQRIIETIHTIAAKYEIILVNDASPDLAWETIVTLNLTNHCIKGINLARNFGQHHAITAGLDYANGDWVVVMDCDLQDKPEEIIRLFQKSQEGYAVVFGKRVTRQDHWWKKKTSQIFYRVYDYFTGTTSDHTIANFCIISKKVVHGFRQMREQHRFFPLFLQWMGYPTASIAIDHDARKQGKSSYSLKKLITLATDTIIAQSNKPLRLSIQFGFLISSASFIYGLYLFIRYFFLEQPVAGWTSVMVSIYFIGGLIFFNFGILGLYIGKVFNEIKGRPLYLIRETTDDSQKA